MILPPLVFPGTNGLAYLTGREKKFYDLDVRTKFSETEVGRTNGSPSVHPPSERIRRTSPPPDKTKLFSDVPEKIGLKNPSGNVGLHSSPFSPLNIEGKLFSYYIYIYTRLGNCNIWSFINYSVYLELNRYEQ